MKIGKLIVIVILGFMILLSCNTQRKNQECENVEVYYSSYIPGMTGRKYLVMNYTDSVYYISYMGGSFDFGTFKQSGDSMICFPSVGFESGPYKKGVDTVDVKIDVVTMRRKESEIIYHSDFPIIYGTNPNADTLYLRDTFYYNKSKCYQLK